MIVALVFCLMFFILSLFFVLWRWRLRGEINSRIAGIRAAGLPVNWEELAEWPLTIPDSENAALIYTNAFAHLFADGISDNYHFHMPLRGKEVSEEMRSAMESAILTNRRALQITYAASKLTGARYPIDYLEGPAAGLPHLNGLKRIVKLLACEALLKSEAKDSEGALKSVETSLHAACSLDDEPLFISQLVAADLLTTSCRSLEIVLCNTRPAENMLAEVQRELTLAEATNRFAMALIGERALNGEVIRLAQDDVRKLVAIANQGSADEEKTELPTRNPGVGWRLLGFFERDRNFFLRAMETNILVAQTLPPTSLSFSNETTQLETEAKAGFYIFSSIFLPSISRAADRDASLRANLRTAVTAVAIERWSLDHEGKIPDSLNALIPSFLPATPLDPLDGKPLRYKKLTHSYIVYSIGSNLKDDGGKEKPPRSVKVPLKERNKFDITFTVERN
jgi:hypothetical protein